MNEKHENEEFVKKNQHIDIYTNILITAFDILPQQCQQRSPTRDPSPHGKELC